MQLNRETTVALSEMLASSHRDLFDELDVRVWWSSKKGTGSCPVHGGRNITSFNYYLKPPSPGTWKCYSNKCHEKYGISSLGLIQGILENRNGKCTKDEALAWALRFLGKDISEIRISPEQSERMAFSRYFNKQNNDQTLIDKSIVESSLKIPAKHFCDKYKLETLKLFQVGDCLTPGKEMYGRATIPCYENTGKYVVGCTGRAYEGLPKWLNSKKFDCSNHLFNYHRAKEHIRKTGEVYLVEGPPDVMRLHEFGIFNAVALLGSELKDGQEIILESSGAARIFVLTDMDKSGRLAAQSIKKSLNRNFNVSIGEYEAKDPGEMKKFIVKWDT